MAKHVSRDVKPIPLEVVDLREKYFAASKYYMGGNGMTVEATPNVVTNLVEMWVDPAHHRGDAAAAIANLRLTREAAQDLAEQLMQAADRLMPR